MHRTGEALRFFAPEVEVLGFPAWDCLPYDRVSPRSEIVSERLETLSRLAGGETRSGKTGSGETGGGRVVLTTVAAILQRVPPPEYLKGRARHLRPGDTLGPEGLIGLLESTGYHRVDTVMEAGEYAVRGGLMDVFPTGAENPLRLDFFGDELESLRSFDVSDQRTREKAAVMTLKPVRELALDEDSAARFRTGYRVAFGVGGGDDPLYEAVSEGRVHQGMEHWLPLFHERLASLTDYIRDAAVILDARTDEAARARLELIAEYFTARQDFVMSGADMGGAPYRPLPPESLYLTEDEWEYLLGRPETRVFSPFGAVEGAFDTSDAGGRPRRNFGDIRARRDANLYDAVRDFAEEARAAGQSVVVTAYSEGSRDRLMGLMREHGLPAETAVGWRDASRSSAVSFAIVGLESGFRSEAVTLITEQDILGERIARRRRVKTTAENVIAAAAELEEGDLVVHREHGIGRYDGLSTITAGGAPHDCLRLVYAGGDKLFIPVEHLDVISRFGSEQAGVNLDKLGGAGWQARKAKLKERIRGMAARLMTVAAERALRESPRIEVNTGAYDEFCARFPYQETEDQARAIADILEDFTKGRPTDRLICGDVGFGKTEVALRAAFAVTDAGRQVAVVAPTTLLCRQHFKEFEDRFKGFPVRVAQLSRLVTPRQSKETKEALKTGQVDIVVGTHAVLAKDAGFKDLGLLIIDEEQHFGVAHKERLKQLKSDVHVLTLSATPIPRTLQLAMTGLREMSLIATPPVDRLAVRTFVLPFDGVIIREAILREQYRGGQTFYVAPRIADLDAVARELRDLAPEARLAIAHGRMKPADLEEVFSAFAEGAHDVLLSTNIIESGLDLPQVNTIVIHRADMFGLSQLYQLRGRVGRGKTRAYAYLTLPPRRKLTKTAEKRLDVMQTLDTLGAGFTLASHDMDIRGAGNLLGEEQSGHIKEVGVELYQQMLEEAVAEAKGAGGLETADNWSPQINANVMVMIPEDYVPDLNVRLELYRRISRIAGHAEAETLAAEMIDRFGKLPEGVENLLAVVEMKNQCREAGVEKIDAGPKGGVVTFRDGAVANPSGLVRWITAQKGLAKLRPDQKLVYNRDWSDDGQRLKGVRHLVGQLAEVAREEVA